MNGGEHPPWQPPTLERYKIVQLLGEGGMGIVYLAEDIQLGREVAIKFLQQPSQALRERLRREARALACIKHPNVVTVYDIDEAADVPYIVSEYIPGSSLDQRSGPMPWREVLQHGVAIAGGLAAVHRQGLLHRDIKPANIILTDAGDIKLIDFGLARLMAVPVVGERNAETAPIVADASEPPGEVHADRVSTPLASPVAGTPAYMAPELWEGSEPTPRSDVYSCGVLLYELCTGTRPGAMAGPERIRLDMPGVAPGFAEIVNRCLELRPERRYASGADLMDALVAVQSALDAPRSEVNPYQGLRPFTGAQRHLFFGRERDTQLVLDQVRADPFVMVIGESGAGKSSLIAAGVLPRIGDGALMNGRAYRICTVTPGPAPVVELLRTLARHFDLPAMADPEQGEPRLVARLAAGDFAPLVRPMYAEHQAPVGTVLFFDQLEEIVTLANSDDAAVLTRLIAHLAEKRIPGLHILATLRGDHVGRVAGLPGMDRIWHQIRPYYLAPPAPAAIRDAVVGPAAAAGVRFESDALVDKLAATAHRHDGGLPLLQFVLAELWDARDQERGVITVRALEDIGGVDGALARHADRVLGVLDSDHYQATRAIFLQLVTRGRTRRRCTAVELGAGDPVRDQTLDVLVRGRLLVAHGQGGEATYEIAHEALVRQWDRLANWVDEHSDVQYIKERLVAAAAEWEQLGRGAAGLWSAPQLARLERIQAEEHFDMGTLSDLEVAFVTTSRRALLRKRRLRGLVAAVLVMAVAGPVAVAGYNRFERNRAVDTYLGIARRSLGEAAALRAEFDRHRRDSMAIFRDPRSAEVKELRDEAERLWGKALEIEPALEVRYREADHALEVALELDSDRGDARAAMVEALDAHAGFADALGQRNRRDELLGQLHTYSEAVYAAWVAPVPVQLTVEPAANLRVERYELRDDAKFPLHYVERINSANVPSRLSLPPGSYRFTAEWHGHDVHYPVLIRPEDPPLEITLARPPDFASMAEHYAYIPAGRFIAGYGQSVASEPLRKFFQAPPVHERDTGAYWIGRYEVTYGEWIEFLRDCSPGKQCPRLGRSNEFSGLVAELRNYDSDTWELAWTEDDTTIRARSGQLLIYEARTIHAAQNWLRMPVMGVSSSEVNAYLAWLRDTGRVPGARFCTADEWERAARGADARTYPHGDALTPEEANMDETYGQKHGAYGPDEVGSYSDSVSPFGLSDMAGNVWEMTALGADDDSYVRGGSFYNGANENNVAVRWFLGSGARMPLIGFRVCANPAP